MRLRLPGCARPDALVFLLLATVAEELAAVALLLSSIAKELASVNLLLANVAKELATVDLLLARVAKELASVDLLLANVAEELASVDLLLANVAEELASVDLLLANVAEELASVDLLLANVAEELASVDLLGPDFKIFLNSILFIILIVVMIILIPARLYFFIFFPVRAYTTGVNKNAAVQFERKGEGGATPDGAPGLNFQALWREYYPKLTLFVRPFFTAPTDCEDAVQEIFLRIFRSLRTFNGRFSAGTWIYRIARNYCTDCGRKRARRLKLWGRTQDLDHEARLEKAFNPEQALLDKETGDKLKAAIGTLDPTDQQICFLYHFEDLTYRDLHRALAMPEGTLKSRMRVIKETVRKIMEDYHG
jgi:RNA polymerase sigma-70 factor (ECF subfamily)